MLVAMTNPFRYFNSSPDVIRLVVMMYVRYPLSLRNVEDLLAERGVDISPETVRFGGTGLIEPVFASIGSKSRVASECCRAIGPLPTLGPKRRISASLFASRLGISLGSALNCARTRRPGGVVFRKPFGCNQGS